MRAKIVQNNGRIEPVFEPKAIALSFLLAYEIGTSTEVAEMLIDWNNGVSNAFPGTIFRLNLTVCEKLQDSVYIQYLQIDSEPQLVDVLNHIDFANVLIYWNQAVTSCSGGSVSEAFRRWKEI